jgi:predicted dienelactone hydrolase
MHNSKRLFVAALFAVIVSSCQIATAAAVEAITQDWHDTARDRSVPVKLYLPAETAAVKGPRPTIIFSHGLGGSREGYEYLGRHWAEQGYVSVHLQHLGSDAAVWKDNPRPMDALRQAAAMPANSLNRVLDVRFALDQLEKLNREPGPLHGRIDLQRIGMAGHSYGAWTTLAVAGQVFFGPGGKELSGADPRIKAALPMSAPAPRDKTAAKLDAAFAKIKIPVMHMTGTLDDSPIGETKAAERRLPFDHIRGADQYLITFAGGDHMIFSGRGRLPGNREKDEVFHRLILRASTAFWDAYLRDDAKAKEFLQRGGLEKTLAADAKLEMSLHKPR